MAIAYVFMAAFKIGIALLLWVSLFTKESSPSISEAELPPTLRWLPSLIEGMHTPFVIAIVFLLLDGSVFGALFLLATMVGVGIALKKLGNVDRCNCYGSLAKNSSQGERWLNYALLVMATTVLLIRLHFGDTLELAAEGKMLFPACLVVAAVAAFVIKRNDRKAVAAAEEESASAMVSRVFPGAGETLVGHEPSGETVLLHEIAETCPMIVFIALSSQCGVCKSLKPILFPVTRLFSKSLRSVFLVDDLSSYETADDDLLFKGDKDFMARLGGGKFPFAAVVNSQSLSIVGSVAYGDEIGSLNQRGVPPALPGWP